MNIKNLIDIPLDDITKLTKAKADNYTQVVKSRTVMIGVVGTIIIIEAIITLVKNHDNNNHEERMMEFELKKLELESKNNKDKEEE